MRGAGLCFRGGEGRIFYHEGNEEHEGVGGVGEVFGVRACGSAGDLSQGVVRLD